MRHSPRYQDFSIRLRVDPTQGPMLRIDRAPYGSVREAPLVLPVAPGNLDSLLVGLEQEVRSSGSASPGRDLRRRQTEGQGESPARLGESLFSALFPPPLRESLVESLGWAEGHDRALRIRLVLDPGQPDLALAGSLPWELLYRSETRSFLGRSVLTPFVRQLEGRRLNVQDPPQPPLRVLVAMAHPRGATRLDLDDERRRLEDVWRHRPEVEFEILTHATLREVRQRLRDQAFHVLHFMGHGDFDPATGEGTLLLETADGEEDAVSGAVLAAILEGSRALRLVFLNACETALLARSAGQDPYSGVASALVLGGIPMVLAMQFSISDAAAIAFSDAFYAALAAGDLVETAVSEGRIAIHREAPSSWEWITPVLFMSLDEGRILDVSPLPLESQTMSKYETKADQAKAVLVGDNFRVDGGLHFTELYSPDEEGKHQRGLGRENLDRGNHRMAEASLRKACELTSSDDEDHYRLALARLAVRRPFKLTRAEIREIEELLQSAIRIQQLPHYLLFWAFLKYDYFVLNGMNGTEPNHQALIRQAISARPDPAALRYLLNHLPEASNNPVRALISDFAQAA